MTNFFDVVDAADNLSVDEQQTLVEILQRRIAKLNRAAIVRDVADARAEFQRGDAWVSSVSDIIEELRSET